MALHALILHGKYFFKIMVRNFSLVQKVLNSLDLIVTGDKTQKIAQSFSTARPCDVDAEYLPSSWQRSCNISVIYLILLIFLKPCPLPNLAPRYHYLFTKFKKHLVRNYYFYDVVKIKMEHWLKHTWHSNEY